MAIHKYALGTFTSSLRSWRIWYSLAMQDILLRYRGSVLGPFWITISTAITIYSMGFLYGVLFGMDRSTYLPYFATGMIAWTFISMIINESTKILLESKHYMENMQISCVVYVFRLIFRNVIIFGHNLLVYISILALFHLEVGSTIFLLIPGLLILSLNGIFYGTVIAFISTRFPDVGSIISSILQVFFFITPIMWMPSALPIQFNMILTLNPFVYFVDLLRKPLLGIAFDSQEIIAVALLTLFGMMLFTVVLRKYHSRIVFWL